MEDLHAAVQAGAARARTWVESHGREVELQPHGASGRVKVLDAALLLQLLQDLKGSSLNCSHRALVLMYAYSFRTLSDGVTLDQVLVAFNSRGLYDERGARPSARASWA